MNTFADYKLASASEKITLATLNASKRLMGWTLSSGSVYVLSGFTNPIIVSLTQNALAVTQVASMSALTSGTYFLDVNDQALYVWLQDSTNPNASFMAMVTTFFYASAPVTLAYDLGTGFQVYWEPQVKTTSQFGVAIDVVNQVSEAIEGTGSLTLHNDQSFWAINYDKLFFDNQRCRVYSWNRDLPAAQAKLLFDGLVLTKSYSPTDITFQLSDLLSQLRTPIPLNKVGAITAQTPADVQKTYQRMIFGRVDGHRPVNIDQVITNVGYPRAGTLAIANASVTITGTGTSFLADFSPSDGIYLGSTKYTIATVVSDTSMTVTQLLTSATITSQPVYIVPALPKRYTNRVWKVAGHPLRQPTFTISGTSTIQRLVVSSTQDIIPGDEIYIGTIGSGQVATVASVLGFHTLTLTGSLATIPSIGTVVTRPAIQYVRLNGLKLNFYEDFTIDATAATLTLRNSAEANRAPLLELGANLRFIGGSRTVSVLTSGASIQGIINPGDEVGTGQSYLEVLSVDSPTQLTLRTPWPLSVDGPGQYKSYTFDQSKDVLTCSCLGRTDDGTATGNLMGTGPEIIKTLLTDMGLAATINTASFDDTLQVAYQRLGIVIPAKYNDTAVPTYTTVINQVNKSILGTLIQDENFLLKHSILRPQKTPTAATYFTESDILSLKVTTTNVNSVRDMFIQYSNREYDYLVSAASLQTATKDSAIANYLTNNTRSKTIATLLYDDSDAMVYANRWSFLLESATSVISFTSKLQAIDLEVNSIVDINHRKLYQRLGGATTRKICLIQKIVKSGTDVLIEAIDLGNCFNRAAAINDIATPFSDTSEDLRIYGGFYTDAYGMQNNDPSTFGSNLIW
jgi:hypothetical protein